MGTTKDLDTIEDLLRTIKNRTLGGNIVEDAFKSLEKLSQVGKLSPHDELELAKAYLIKDFKSKEFTKHTKKAADSNFTLIYLKDILRAKLNLVREHNIKLGEQVLGARVHTIPRGSIKFDFGELEKLLNEVNLYCCDYDLFYDLIEQQKKTLSYLKDRDKKISDEIEKTKPGVKKLHIIGNGLMARLTTDKKINDERILRISKIVNVKDGAFCTYQSLFTGGFIDEKIGNIMDEKNVNMVCKNELEKLSKLLKQKYEGQAEVIKSMSKLLLIKALSTDFKLDDFILASDAMTEDNKTKIQNIYNQLVAVELNTRLVNKDRKKIPFVKRGTKQTKPAPTDESKYMPS